MLYQLSYTHHGGRPASEDAVAPAARTIVPVTRGCSDHVPASLAAADLGAVVDDVAGRQRAGLLGRGPGGGTNTASR